MQEDDGQHPVADHSRVFVELDLAYRVVARSANVAQTDDQEDPFWQVDKLLLLSPQLGFAIPDAPIVPRQSTFVPLDEQPQYP